MRTARTNHPAYSDDSAGIGGGRFAKLGFYVFLAVLTLAPLLGGTPVGPDYALAAWGGDSMSGVVRALVLVAALLTATLGAAHKPAPTVAAIVARYGIYGAALWVAISAFVHSRFFTSPVYVFAMLPEALNWLVFAVVLALTARFASEDKANLSRMAIALLIGGVFCAVIGVLSFGTIPGAERIAQRESATFFSPNFAAGFCALTIPVAVAMLLSAEGLLAVVLAATGTGLLFSLLMITGSRAGLGLTFSGLVVALFLALVRKTSLPWKRVGVAVAVLALAGVVFGAPMLGRVRQSANSKVAASLPTNGAAATDDHSGEFRKETWRGSLAMAADNPVFGAGPGTYPYTYSRYARVGWTGQAHSSYLQVASESGLPALILLLVGIGGVLTVGLSQKEATKTATPVLLSALFGGVIAALGRNIFDSEWMLLACGVPFFCVLGMLVGASETAPQKPVEQTALARGGTAVFLAVTLVLTLFVRAGQAERDALVVLSRTSPGNVAPLAKEAAERVQPSDPQIYALAGDYNTAAYLSPSGKRFYQFARALEREGSWEKAVDQYKRAADADPNNLQTRKALAETQEKAGDAAGAIFTYLDMTKIAEGPAGKIRAIPELVDTLPAFAYAALGEDALKRGEAGEAYEMFVKAREIVEDYSRTTPQYQFTEIATLGGNVDARRAEVRSLYTDRIVPGNRAALQKLRQQIPASLGDDQKETLARLDAFVTVPTPSTAPP
ncbi:MAG: O-antigen ligase family protein [Akkermansiaceae bacterium]|nr:O-antigen ligase family protein [Armatimonadota bacterium]